MLPLLLFIREWMCVFVGWCGAGIAIFVWTLFWKSSVVVAILFLWGHFVDPIEEESVLK